MTSTFNHITKLLVHVSKLGNTYTKFEDFVHSFFISYGVILTS